jgi:hypothetical protein
MIESFGKDRRRHAVQKFSYGRARGWHPDRLVLECECGRFLFYPDPRSVCQPGNDHTSLVQELTGMKLEEEYPPRYDSRSWLHER